MKSFAVGLVSMFVLALATGLVMSVVNQPTAKQSLALQSVHLDGQ